MKVHELLTDASKWAKGEMALSEHGISRDSLDDDAARWCLAGAIARCYRHPRRDEVIDLVEQELRVSITHWNDTPARTFNDVRDLVTRLDI